MANARGKSVDKTHLSIDQAERRGFLHRDYIAHCLRWSHIVKHLQQKQRYKDAVIFDVGCGKEMPLIKTLYSSRMSPREYTGFDVNKLEMPDMFKNAKFKPKFFGELDFAQYISTSAQPTLITCFEVVEHVEPAHAIAILKNIRTHMTSDTHAFVSTPCWDPHVGAAANHVNEMKYGPFGATLEAIGFQVENQWGTFASIKDYIDQIDELGETVREIFDELREYYDTNVLACIFAPLFPSHSRNCLWHLSHKLHTPQFADIHEWPTPWTSSEEWKDLAHV